MGSVLNSVTMEVYPIGDKIQKALELVRETRARTRDLATTIGDLNDLNKGCEYGMSHYRFLERDKTKALGRNRGDFEACLKLSGKTKKTYSGGPLI